jgi:hypothetical protein
VVLIATAVMMMAVGFVGSACAGVAQLDRSFGVNGVLDIAPPDPSPFVGTHPSAGLQVTQIRAARSGAVYVLGRTSVCRNGGCPQSDVVYRYDRHGSPDATFGGPNGFFDVPRSPINAVLDIDSVGRPLLTQIGDGHHAVVRRLRQDGQLDRSFGEQGVVELECACANSYPNWAGVSPGRGGSVMVVITAPLPQSGKYRSVEPAGTIFRIYRLRADGSVDRDIGRGGRVAFSLRGVDGGNVTAPTPSGGLYLAGRECCDSGIPAFLARISARGRLDRRFLDVSRRSLKALRRLHSLSRWIVSVQVRRGGKIDLLGTSGEDRGFVLRLRPNGRRFQRYAKGGLRALPLPVASAVPGAEGSTIAVSEFVYGKGRRLFRILPGGRLDPSFGRSGTTVTGRLSGEGIQLDAVSGRRLALSTLGVQECRTSCAPTPSVARYLEPRRHR